MTKPLGVHRLVVQGGGLASTIVERASAVTLDWHRRQCSRFAATDSAGRALAIILPRGRVLRGGDVLVAEDGSLVRVLAACQALLVVRPRHDANQSGFALLRAAYHLGNRHVQLELRPDRLLLEPDPVLEELLHRMGLEVTHEDGPFEPEAGAYAAGHSPERGSHSHDHSHDHAPGHAHEHP
jgi:urease accessory protein